MINRTSASVIAPFAFHFAFLFISLTSGAQQDSTPIRIRADFPGFVRQGDRMELIVQLFNTSKKEVTGQVQLELMDSATGNSIDGWFINSFPNQYFTAAATDSSEARFPVQVPHQFDGVLKYKISVSVNGAIHSAGRILRVVPLVLKRSDSLTARKPDAPAQLSISEKIFRTSLSQAVPGSLSVGDGVRIHLEVNSAKKLSETEIRIPLMAGLGNLKNLKLAGVTSFKTFQEEGELRLVLNALPAGKTMIEFQLTAQRAGFYNSGQALVHTKNGHYAMGKNIEMNVD